MRKNCLLIVCLAFMGSLLAQAPKTKTSYYLITQGALLNGDHSASAQVQLAGGFEKNNWAFGLGAAIDYYKIRTVPVFADARFFFGKDKAIFSYADLGYDMVWPLETQYRNYWTLGGPYQRSDFRNGFYTDLGIGYALKRKNKGVIISLGYSMKTITEKYNEVVYSPTPPYSGTNTERRAVYELNRISLKLGYSF
jgi:hypothetical protein